MPTEMPRRSDTTKSAILQAARERFAADGFERATIRSIAAAAEIDPAMVMRYFGSKDKLFAAAAEFDLRIPDVSTGKRKEVGVRLAGHFIERWEGDDTLMALLRAAVSHEAAASRMQQMFAEQLVPVATALAPDPADGSRRAGLVATQMIGFAMCRYVLRLPPVVALPREEAVSWLGPTLQRYLTAAAA